MTQSRLLINKRTSTYASGTTISRAELAFGLDKAYSLSTGTPELQALTVKICRADYVHASLSRTSSAHRAARTLQASRVSVLRWIACEDETHFTGELRWQKSTK